jgi:hypothetical protein
MAVFNLWSFRSTSLNTANISVRMVDGPNALPPIRGGDFIPMGRTGSLFVPKVHGARRIALELQVLGATGAAQADFDTLAALFANRAQGALVNSDGANPRTGQAECVGWYPKPPDVSGRVWAGVADFSLADPWLYGAVVTGNVVPNAGAAFGPSVVSNISGPRTTWAATLGAGSVVSGQPILVVHMTQGTTTALTSIADTFGGHYTYTQVDLGHTYQNCEMYIATGGTGTGGVITVTAASALIGGFVIPLTGANTGAGLAAVDVHGHASGAVGAPLLSLTPTASNEAALYTAVATYSAQIYGSGGAGWYMRNTPAYSGDANIGAAEIYIYPASGVALADYFGASPAGPWDMVGAIVKGSGAPVTLNLTNTGTATAEKITIDCLGPIINPTITNTTNGTSVTVNTSVLGTKHLLIDTGAFTALNDGTNVIGNLTHSGALPFLTINPGANVLQISGSACTGSTLVTVTFLPPFV